jgi:hypothetical protein
MTNNPKITVNDLLKGLIGSGIIITDWTKINKRMDILFGCNTNVEITINKNKEQVLVDVKGGLVQDIWSTSENIGFTVIDWDNIDSGQGVNDLYEMGDYSVAIKTKDEILNEINEANQEILDNNEFFNEDLEY